MRIIFRFLLLLIFAFGFFNFDVNAGFFSDLLEESEPKIDIDCGGKDCNLHTGTEIVKDTVTGIETERTFSEYIQDVIAFLLGFISILSVCYIIYAGFRILTGAGEEDVLKKQKSTILYVIIGMAVIWLAYPIVTFIIDVLNQNPNP